MTVEEIFAQAEERRAAKQRSYVPVNFIPRTPRRSVRLERHCVCAQCEQWREVVNDEQRTA
jgi:hypothetical protein